MQGQKRIINYLRLSGEDHHQTPFRSQEIKQTPLDAGISLGTMPMENRAQDNYEIPNKTEKD